MKTKLSTLATQACLIALFPTSLSAQIASLSSVDRIVGEQEAGGPGAGYQVDAPAQIGTGGATGSRIDTNVILGFTLPTLPAGETVQNARFSFEITGARSQTGAGNLPNLHVYLLDSAAPESTGTSYFYHGVENGTAAVPFIASTRVSVTGLDQNTFEPGAEKRIMVLTGDTLTLFQGFYNGDHIPEQTEVFVRFNMDVNPDETVGGSLTRYNLSDDPERVSIEINAPASTLTYLDATTGIDGNTFATGGSPDDLSWINPDAEIGSDNDQWRVRAFGNDATVLQALHASDVLPEITTEITGLADGTYDVWAFFWDGPNANTWTLSAGLNSANLETYSFDGLGDTASPVPASSLIFANPPVMTIESPRILYGVKVGQSTVSQGSTIRVYIDNNEGGGSNTRTWYDGVGYQPATLAPAGLRISSFVPLPEDVWEVSLTGQANTEYRVFSSSDLTFQAGVLLENLVPGDSGTIGGEADSVVTTNGQGLAKFRLSFPSSLRADFIRAEIMP